MNHDGLFDFANREDIIFHYFQANLSYSEILYFLEKYRGWEISLRHLHRILRKCNLSRRLNKSTLNSVIDFVKEQLHGSSSLKGYRYMHIKARMAGLVVDRETIRTILKALNSEGVLLRAAHKLQRRVYVSNGANEIWHIDGYDKLKPFGFAIHGCIDGFSRRILWLKVASTNNNPKVIASYFINCFNSVKKVQKVIRADRGTENIYVCGMQRYFRRNDRDLLSTEDSFQFGSSTGNQRIESWWSQFRRSKSNWWINYFKDMREQNILDSSNIYHLEAIRFCYLPILETKLNDFVNIWNTHRIRSVRNSECSAGRPNVIYYAPERFGGSEMGFPLNLNDLIVAKQFCQEPSSFGCSTEFLNFAALMMQQNNTQLPTTASEARDLYVTIIQQLES